MEQLKEKNSQTKMGIRVFFGILEIIGAVVLAIIWCAAGGVWYEILFGIAIAIYLFYKGIKMCSGSEFDLRIGDILAIVMGLVGMIYVVYLLAK